MRLLRSNDRLSSRTCPGAFASSHSGKRSLIAGTGSSARSAKGHRGTGVAQAGNRIVQRFCSMAYPDCAVDPCFRRDDRRRWRGGVAEAPGEHHCSTATPALHRFTETVRLLWLRISSERTSLLPALRMSPQFLGVWGDNGQAGSRSEPSGVLGLQWLGPSSGPHPPDALPAASRAPQSACPCLSC